MMNCFWNAFINSFKYMVMIVPLELAVSLFLAYLLNDEKNERTWIIPYNVFLFL